MATDTTTTAPTDKGLVGKVGNFCVPLRTGEGVFRVQVRVIDQRKAFGRCDIKITPVSGSGETWVSDKAVEL